MNYTLEEIKKAAERRGIAWSYPGGAENDDFLVLRYGSREVMVQKTRTPFLSAVALRLSTDKFLAARVLERAGLPVAPQQLANTAGEAEAFLRRYAPIVVKPNRADRGLGVHMEVRNGRDLSTALLSVLNHGPALLERQAEGEDYRLLVIGGRFVACYERKLPATVAAGPRPALNLHLGAVAVDRTDAVHPANRELAVRAAGALEIDVAGVDLVCRDIAEPVRSPEDGVILEVNSMPGVRGFLRPAEGRPRPVLDAYLDYLFPSGRAR